MKIKIDSKSIYGQTALHIAAIKGDIHMVVLLISKGADVNAKDNNGWTPLHMASWAGHDKIVSFLVKNGAKVNNIAKGTTPLGVKLKSRRKENIVKLKNGDCYEFV